jgi:acetyl-CoA acyltransferase
MKKAVIVGYVRTPFHFATKGDLAKLRPDDMATAAVKALVERTHVKVGDIEDLLMGCAFPEGEQGFNIGRLVVLNAGFPISMGGATINRFCGSSMQSIHTAVGAIAVGAGEVFICAGVESMSRIPMGGFNPLPNPDLYERVPGAYMSMGETAENVAERFKVLRKDQDEFALRSQKKAADAQSQGRLIDEIVPIVVRGNTVSQDGCLRPDTTAEGLASLKPAFDEKGTVTAGTSSPLTDGSAATLVCSEEYAKANGLEILAYVKSMAVAGCDPEIMGIGPVAATRKALERAGLKASDLDIIELNEAFASQAIACIRELGLDEAKVNLDGGAIALGHPLGATGARITGKVAALLKRENKRYGLATQCIGGGQGIATILERVS